MAATHAKFVEFLRNGKTRHVFFYEKGCHAAGTEFGLTFGVHHQGIGVGPIGDPHLVPVQEVVAALVFGAQFHRQHIAARAGLTHRERTHVFAADELGKVFFALRFAAVAFDLVDTQIAVCAVRQADRRTGARNFFHGHHVRQIAHVGATVLFTNGDTQNAQAAHLAPQIHGKLVAAIDFGRTRRNLSLGKFTHCIAQGINVFSQLKIQSWHIHGIHPCSVWFSQIWVGEPRFVASRRTHCACLGHQHGRCQPLSQ